MAKKIKMVIFDLDGTLVNAFGAVAGSLNYSFRQLGLPRMARHDIERRVGWGERVLVEKCVPAEFVERVLKIYRGHHARGLVEKNGVRFLPGARKVLDELKRSGYRLAIASNRPHRFTQIILRHLDVRRHFDFVLCGDKVSRPKPSGMILRVILSQAGLTPGQALYVGDMPIDAQTGRRARVKTVAIVTGSYSAQEVEKENPFLVIQSLPELLDIVAGLG